MRSVLHFLFFGLVILLPLSLLSQNTSVADSLKHDLEQATDDSLKVHLLKELSWEFSASDAVKAKKFARKAIAISKEMGDMELLASSYNHLGLAFDYEGVSDSITKYFGLGLKLMRQLGDSSGMGNVLMNWGVSYYYRGNYDSAMVYIMKTLSIREAMNDTLRVAQCFNNIGLLNSTQGNYAKAKDYYLRAAAIKKRFSDKISLLNTYNNLSVISQHLEQYDSSFFYAQKVLDIAVQLNDSSEIGGAYGNLGMSHFKKGEHAQAIKFLEKATRIFEHTDHFQTLPLSYKNLADAYAANGQTEKAIAVYIKSLKLAKEQEIGEVVSDDLLGLSEMYDRSGKHTLALKYFKQYHNLNREAFSLEKASVIEDLNTKYETEKKEQEIAILNAEKAKDKAEITSKNAQRNLFLGVSIAAVLVLMLAGFSLLKIRSKNRVIQTALEEKGVLLREIHHRVKNNLQMISSLLSLQSRYVDDDRASKALKESRNRVASVGLIHQRLYQEDNLTGVLMQEYVPQLVDELLGTMQPHKMDVQLNIADLNLDIDTVIPLGLVLNELITNVLKYASSNAQNLLSISLLEKNNQLVLSVVDSGAGLPKDFDPTKTRSYGVKLIRSLSRKLDADVEYINQNIGLEVKVTIKKYKLAV